MSANRDIAVINLNMENELFAVGNSPQSRKKKKPVGRNPNSWVLQAVSHLIGGYIFYTIAVAVIAGGPNQFLFIAAALAGAFVAVGLLFRIPANTILLLSGIVRKFIQTTSGAVLPSFIWAIVMILADFLAVVLAAVTNQYVFGYDVSLAIPAVGSGFTQLQAFSAEVICSAIVVIFFVLKSGHENGLPFMPYVLSGIALFFCTLAVGLISGCSVNPMRALGPMIVSAIFPPYTWIYIVGPLLGALMALIVAYLFDIYLKRTV